MTQLVSETIVYGLPSVFVRLLGFITFPIYTRLLDPSDYGAMAMVTAVTALLTAATTLGIDGAMAILVTGAKTTEERQSVLTTALVSYLFLSLIGACVLLATSSLLAQKLLSNRSDGRTILVLVSFAMFLGSLPLIGNLTLRLQRRKWWVAGMALTQAASNTAVGVVFVAVFRQGVQGIYVAQILTGVLFFVGYAWILRQNLDLAPWSRTHFRDLLRLGIPTLPAYFATWVVGASDRFFLEHFRGLSDVGLVSVAQSLSLAVGVLCSGFVQAWTPFSLSLQYHPDAKQIYSKTLTYFLAVTCAAAVMLSAFATEVIGLLAPRTYHDASLFVAYYTFASVATGVYFIVSIGINLSRKTHYIGIIGVTAAVFNVALNALLIPRHGMAGAALSTLLSHWLGAVSLYWAAQRSYRIPYRVSDVAWLLGSASLAIALTRKLDTGTQPQAFLLKLIVVSLFLGLILLRRIVTPAQLAAFSRRFASLLCTPKVSVTPM